MAECVSKTYRHLSCPFCRQVPTPAARQRQWEWRQLETAMSSASRFFRWPCWPQVKPVTVRASAAASLTTMTTMSVPRRWCPSRRSPSPSSASSASPPATWTESASTVGPPDLQPFRGIFSRTRRVHVLYTSACITYCLMRLSLPKFCRRKALKTAGAGARCLS